MRHGDFGSTMNIYTHAQAEHITTAVNTLPEFGKQTAFMTGTDDKTATLTDNLQGGIINNKFSPRSSTDRALASEAKG